MKPEKKKFLFDAMKIKADDFRMPDDGRQWRASAAQRKTLFINLAAFADKCGRGACPSVQTLRDRTGFSRSTTFRYLADLLLAGWITNRGKSRFQGTTTWDLNLIPIVPDSPLNGVKVEPAKVSKSPVNGVKVEPNSLKVEPIVSKSNEKGLSLTPELPLHLPTESAQNHICPPTNLPETDGGMEGGSGHDSKSTSKTGQEKDLWHRLFDAYTVFYKYDETLSDETYKTTGKQSDIFGRLPRPESLPRTGIKKLEASLPGLYEQGYDIDQVIAGWSHWLNVRYHGDTKFSKSQKPIQFPVALFAEEAAIYVELAIEEKLEDEQEQKELNAIALEEKPA